MAGRRIALGLMAALAACTPLRQPELARPAPAFDPIRFFAGRTEGQGGLTVGFWKHERIKVEGQGRLDPDGALVLTQTVHRGDGPAETRSWRILPQGEGRYTATLTDAAGPVSVEATGNALHIRYRTRDGLDAEQQLYLSRDGRRAENRLAFRKRGVRVATLEERITRLD